ncbi:pilus assembly protein PilE [Rhodanobacter sp. FW510-R12]|nr:pilus assembly protein PilE [Rhodanobacter sp. FW104-R8]KZC25429.1 pilus assembly protein PilE [Rhodanobacter sp. FW510-T8]KZC31377.1 pilus assembly protein PilE [Rhodanobacter sp. FW510-R10]
MKYRCSARGFTLLELMIVVAIVAILAAIAYPSYTNQVVKTRRSAAKACLSQYANYMERYYTTNLRYDQDAAAVANPFTKLDCDTQTAAYYTYNDGTPGQTTYTVKAVPVNAQLAADTQCGTLSLDQTGKRNVTGTGTVDQCW